MGGAAGAVVADGGGGVEVSGRFFVKKDYASGGSAKNFCSGLPGGFNTARSGAKVFWFFFSKKNFLILLTFLFCIRCTGENPKKEFIRRFRRFTQIIARQGQRILRRSRGCRRSPA